MQRVLLTGAAGDIGGRLRKLLKPDLPGAAPERHQEAGRLEARRALRRCRPCSPRGGGEGWWTASRASSTSGGHSVEGPWETILQANIIGCYNLFEAARRKGVKRVVFASSNHAVGFYPRYPPHRHRRHRAARLALWRQQGVRRGAGLALRRQARAARAVPQDRQRRRPAARPAPAVDLDLARRTWRSSCASASSTPSCASRSSTAPPTTSAAWWDNHRAYAYGYRPTGRAEDHREHAFAEQAKLQPDPVGDFFQGGTFCSAEFDGDTGRVWK